MVMECTHKYISQGSTVEKGTKINIECLRREIGCDE